MRKQVRWEERAGKPEGRAAAAREFRHEKHGRGKKKGTEYKFNGRFEERGSKKINLSKANCKFQLS